MTVEHVLLLLFVFLLGMFSGMWLGYTRAPKEMADPILVKEREIIQSPDGPPFGVELEDKVYPIFNADLLAVYIARNISVHGVIGRPKTVAKLLDIVELFKNGGRGYQELDKETALGWNSKKATPALIANTLNDDIGEML